MERAVPLCLVSFILMICYETNILLVHGKVSQGSDLNPTHNLGSVPAEATKIQPTGRPMAR